jgi:uncharacterized protein YegL
MMLDSSSSMEGKRWTDLLYAYKKFVNHLAGNNDLKVNSKLTVITFNSAANIVFQQETPDENLISKIKFTGGGTDFS